MSAKCRAWSKFGKDTTSRTLPKVAFCAGWDAAKEHYEPKGVCEICEIEAINVTRLSVARAIMQMTADRLYNGCHIGMAAIIKEQFGLSD